MIGREFEVQKTVDQVKEEKKQEQATNIVKNADNFDQKLVNGDKSTLLNTGLRRNIEKQPLDAKDGQKLGEAYSIDKQRGQFLRYDNIAEYRLNEEMNILNSGHPESLNGCTKNSKRKAWKKKHQDKVNAAKREYLNQTRRQQLTADEQIAVTKHITNILEDESVTFKLAKGEIKSDKKLISQGLTAQNEMLLTAALAEVDSLKGDSDYKPEDLFNEYAIKDQKNAKVTDKFRYENADGINGTISMNEIGQLFQKIHRISFEEESHAITKKENGGIDANKVIELAKELYVFLTVSKLPVPDELTYIMEYGNNSLLQGMPELFDVQNNPGEAYMLLLAAASKTYYECINIFAGQSVKTDDYKKEELSFAKGIEKDEVAYNYDLLNKKQVSRIRMVMDTSSAYADRIRKNRLKINKMKNQNKSVKAGLAQNMDEEVDEKTIAEWKKVIKNGPKGTDAVDTTDLKKVPWVLAPYSAQLIEIMKGRTECKNLKGTDLVRYLMNFNNNVHHNILQFKDEIPKTEIGAKFAYLPKLADQFFNNLAKEKFEMLLKPDLNFREMLTQSTVINDFFDRTAIRMVKNRQTAIINTINEVLGTKYYTSTRVLKNLWENPVMQNFLLRGTDKKLPAIERVIAENKFDIIGTDDKQFLNDLEKIKYNVAYNLNIINDKIKNLGLCDSVTLMVRKTAIGNLGAEYLTGYAFVNEDIIDNVVRNLMAYDGKAATIQKIWDKKFSGTGMPEALSSKIERKVRKRILDLKGSAALEKNYLQLKDPKAQKDESKAWDDVNKTADTMLKHFGNLYKNAVKTYMNSFYAKRKDDKKQTLRLTRQQWNSLEDAFENIWVDKFSEAYMGKEFSTEDIKKFEEPMEKDLDAKLKELDFIKENERNMGDPDYCDTLITRAQYEEGTENGNRIEFVKPLSEKDVEQQILNNEIFNDVFKNDYERRIFKECLEDELREKTSDLHKKYPYLENVRSIEQLRSLGVVDYNQFFADIKINLSASIQTSRDSLDNTLLLSEWKMAGFGGKDFGIKKALLQGLINGTIDGTNYYAKVSQEKKKAEKIQEYSRMRVDAFLASDEDAYDNYFKFNYLEITGKNKKEVAATKRVKKCNFAKSLWNMVSKASEGSDESENKYDLTESFALLIKRFQMGVKDRFAKDYKDNAAKSEKDEFAKREDYAGIFRKFGEALENLEFAKADNGKWEIVSTDFKWFIENNYLQDFTVYESDKQMLESIKNFGNTLKSQDLSSEKQGLKECFGEIMLYGGAQYFFENGRPGANVFLDADDTKYYKAIMEKSAEISINRDNIRNIIENNKFDTKKKNSILRRMMPVIVGLKTLKSFEDSKTKTDNYNTYGVEDINDLNAYLADKYFTEDLDEHENIGKVYVTRRDYLDNFGEDDLKKGKFKLIRDYLFKDPTQWTLIMQGTDEEFRKHVDSLNRLYGPMLDTFRRAEFRASGPINDQYIMSNWEEIQKRITDPDWTKDKWFKDIDQFHDNFYNAQIAGNDSIIQNLSNVEYDLLLAKFGYAEMAVSKSLLLEKMSYILQANPSAFMLLYNKKDMMEAINRLDISFMYNWNYLNGVLSVVAENGEIPGLGETKEEKEMLKEAARIFKDGAVLTKKLENKSDREKINLLDQEKKITNDDKLYADYNLLLQVFKPAAYMNSPEQFKAEIMNCLKTYKNAKDNEENSQIYSARNVIKAKDQVRIDIEIRKNQGRILEKDSLKDLADYREKKSNLKSILLVAYGCKVSPETKLINKKRDFVEHNLAMLNNETPVSRFIIDLLAERAVSYGNIGDKELYDLLLIDRERLVKLDNALREDSMDEEFIRKALVFAFAQNAERKGHKLDGTHKGDIEYIAKELMERDKLFKMKKPKTGLAIREYEEFLDEIDMAYYTMSSEELKDTFAKKQKYFEYLDATLTQINTYDSKYIKDNLNVKVGLYEYFKKDIFEAMANGTKIEDYEKSIKDQIDSALAGKEKDAFLQYIFDSSAVMQQVSDKSITAEEKLFSTKAYTRKDLEKEIASSGDDDLIDRYNALSADEQRIFAIALTFPEMVIADAEEFGSNAVLKDKELGMDKEEELQDQIGAFIYGLSVIPKVDYNTAVKRLMKIDRKSGYRRVSKTVFDKAYNYTAFCITQKNKLLPKDYKKMGDGRFTADTGRVLKGKEKEREEVLSAMSSGKYYGNTNFRKFVQGLSEEDSKKDKNALKIYKKLDKLSDASLNMLLHVLQDRSCVDYTTNDRFWKGFLFRSVGYANDEKRQLLKDELRCPEGLSKDMIKDLALSIKEEHYENAVASLFSYQLRDDVDYSKRSVTVDDFKKKSLERTTKVDWELLDNAIALVKEIELDGLKVQTCRSTIEHTQDADVKNEEAKKLDREIDQKFDGKFRGDYLTFFKDFITREAKKNKGEALPLLSAFYGMSKNEQMLMIHALSKRDILDVSTDNTMSTTFGMNEDDYVNPAGRDELADYYVNHLSVAGAKNVLETNQYQLKTAMKMLVSQQVDDSKDINDANSFGELLKGKKLKLHFIGRNTGVDWKLFANAIKFVKRTEQERILMIGNAETYRTKGEVRRYGQFQYNYQYMRKNLYSSGYRVTRFLGRRTRAEIEATIPGYGFGQRIMMTLLDPKYKNFMLDSGIVKVAQSKNAATDYLGYASYGGVATKMTGSTSLISSTILNLSEAQAMGTSIVGDSIKQFLNGITGILNVGIAAKNIYSLNKKDDRKITDAKELEKDKDKKAKVLQTDAQADVMKQVNDRNLYILDNIAGKAATMAEVDEIMDTVKTCVETLSGSTFGVSALTTLASGGMTKIISESIAAAEFITRLFTDRALMVKYFADDGPMGEEIKALRKANLKNRMKEEKQRFNSKENPVLADSDLKDSETKSFEKMSNMELVSKAYGFRDFTEQSNFVGWNIVQSLMVAASPFGGDVYQFMRASIILTAIGCKDVIGKQDNASAEKVFDKLMGSKFR